jgi:hypothetical protein
VRWYEILHIFSQLSINALGGTPQSLPLYCISTPLPLSLWQRHTGRVQDGNINHAIDGGTSGCACLGRPAQTTPSSIPATPSPKTQGAAHTASDYDGGCVTRLT